MRYLLLLVALTACTASVEPVVPPPDSVALALVPGAYQLRSWKGHPLPARWSTGVPGGDTRFTDIVDGVISFTTSGTFTRATTFRTTWTNDSLSFENRGQSGTFTGNQTTGPLELRLEGIPFYTELKGDTLILWCCLDSRTEAWVYVR